MSDSLMKQLVFDCAMELLYGQEVLSNEEIGNKLLNIIQMHDKQESKYGMRVHPHQGKVTGSKNDMDYGGTVGTKLWKQSQRLR